MAQYFQVLSQSDKPVGEEIRQFYPTNIVENQTTTVQYVIGANDQDFQGQQVLVSSDQVMLVDGQPQQIIVDQSQVSFQNQQYVLQDANVEFQEAATAAAAGQQQIFYMDDGNSIQRIETMAEAQPPAAQPVVLNHQLQGSPIHAQLAGNAVSPIKTVVNAPRHVAINQLQQRKPQQVNQATSAIQPRAPTPMNKIKIPTLRVSTPNQEVPSDKKFSTLLNQQKTDDKKKPSRMPLAKSRPPIRSVRPTLSQQGPDSSSTQNRFPSTSRPRPTVRPQAATTQGVVHRQTQPPPQQQQQQQPQQQQPQQHHYVIHNPSYIIQPQTNLQSQQRGSYPVFEPSLQLKQIIEKTPIDAEFRDSIRMLVILSTGEQRLITFTLPKEQCTIMEILEQVGLPILPDTSINCTETLMKEIHYIVHVHYVGDPPFSTPTVVGPLDQDLTASEEPTAAEPTMSTASSSGLPLDSASSVSAGQPTDAALPPPPEPPKELPRIVPGKLAVCPHCGYLNEDFNRCLRCKRKLPEDVKAVNVDQVAEAKKGDVSRAGIKKGVGDKTNGTSSNTKTIPLSPNTSKKRPSRSKVVEQEPIILTLSSDEEEDDPKSITAALKFSESHLSMEEVLKKEPTMTEYQTTELNSRNYVADASVPCVTTSIYCRTVRIGSYRFVPIERSVLISTNEVVIKVPSLKNPSDVKVVKICKSKIVKVLASFNKALPIIFYYVTPSSALQIRNILGMDKDCGYSFDPIAKDEACKRITILPEHFGEEAKSVMKQIYGKNSTILDEINGKEANSILVKTCPKEVTKSLQTAYSTPHTDVRQLLIYPPGKGGLTIYVDDYLCLAQDQFLNDVIIDFYLKYLWLQFSQEQQDKIHMFSTFFYKKLTTKPSKPNRRIIPAETDSNLTPAQKRHARVKSWTKNVNIFDKDYIIIPINESCHWFLAIICFPNMDGCYTMDGKPYKLEPKQKQPVKKKTSLGNVSIAQVKEEATICDGDASDKDEAEGDDSELESEEEVEDTKPGIVPPIKQPCILIFDSLAAGTSRSRVVATLRDYLSCEYRTKMNVDKTFNKDNIKCSCPKVPQQTNFTDCGLYLLQYVEEFLKNPIRSYQFPIKELKTWFEEITVTRKREDIAKLIEELMLKHGTDTSIIPEIQLPTLNGKVMTKSDTEHDEEDVEEETEEESLDNSTVSQASSVFGTVENELDDSKISQSSNETNVDMNSPMISKSEGLEIKRPSNRETLSYLKAKRIIRHKPTEGGSDSKKFKPNEI